MNIGLQHFRLVDTIVKEGTLTRAGEILHLTQSALSHQLKELEKELGTAIFLRKGRKLTLTTEGSRFLKSAERILSEMQLLEKDITYFRQGKIGTLNITTECYTAYHWLPRIIKYYKNTCPDINIHIVSGATHRPIEYLLRGDLDVGIVKTKIDNPNVYYEPIFRDQLLAVMSAEHPLARKETITISDFQNEELFLAYSDPNSGSIPVVQGLMALQGIEPKYIHRIHYTDAIVEMVNSNLGIGVMANWILQPYLETKNIVARPLPAEVGTRTWYAATCKQNVAIFNFLDCLKSHFAEMTMRVPGKEVSILQTASGSRMPMLLG